MKDLNGEDLANYAVCPESWRLKAIVGNDTRGAASSEGRLLRQEWTARAELRQQLRNYTKIVFALLASITGGILLLDSFGFTARFKWREEQALLNPGNFRAGIFAVPSEIGWLLLVVGLLIFIWDLLDRRVTVIQKESGLGKNTELLSARGSEFLPAQVLRSKKRKLFSKPYALLKESRRVIPVDMYPLTNKVRDRHVLPLLLHLSLLHEKSGKLAPYGVLLMGKKGKRIQVANTEQKQRWLESVLAEIRAIESGVPAVATPSHKKCAHCDVEKICSFSALKQEKTPT